MSHTRKHILLIENDPTLADITSFRLELLGHTVTVANSSDKALAWLSEQLPDLIIIGHVLPGIDGAELINQLSNDLRTATTPTIFMSPNSDLEDVQKAFNAGANDYLVIPFDPHTLERKVQHLMSAAAADTL